MVSRFNGEFAVFGDPMDPSHLIEVTLLISVTGDPSATKSRCQALTSVIDCIKDGVPMPSNVTLVRGGSSAKNVE